METKHTPTPWSTSGTKVVDGKIVVAQCKFAGVMSHMQAAHNAAFIVRACNAHEELVAALKEARATIHDLVHQKWNEVEYWLGNIDAAIAKAEGRS